MRRQTLIAPHVKSLLVKHFRLGWDYYVKMEERTDKRGHTYCVEQGQGRVACEGDTSGGATKPAGDGGGSGPVSQPQHGGDNGGGTGGNAGGGGNQPALTKPRILTIREADTKPGDPNLVSASLRQHLNSHQIQGVSLAIEAIEKYGGYLCADGTGVGKTRQILGVAQSFLDKGKKVVVISPAEVIKPDWKKKTMAGSFAHDSVAMGLQVQLIKGDEQLVPGKIQLTTYENLKDLKDKVDKDTILIYDEGHYLKNKDSARFKHAKEANEKVAGVMYATATPADKPLHIAYLARANVFGNLGKTKTYEKLGMKLVDQVIKGGGTIKVWKVDPRIGYEGCARRIAGLFDQMTKDGLMIKREMSMDRVNIQMDRVDLSPQQIKEVDDIFTKKMRDTDDNKAVSLMAARLHQEPMKIPATVKMIQEELAAGRMPVVFAGRVNDIEDEDDAGNTFVQSEGTLKALKNALIAAGIPAADIGELHGGAVSTAAQKKRAMDNFQGGKTKIMLATIQAGGPQPYSAKVLTPTGWRSMGELQVGDTVIAGDGAPTAIKAIFEQGTKPIFQITTASGARTRCTADHIWTARRWSEKKWKDRSLQFLMEHDYRKWMLPVNGCVQFEERPVSVDPYLLGLLLGDGTFRHTSPGFCNMSGSIIEDVQHLAKAIGLGFKVRQEKSLYVGHFSAPFAAVGTRKITKKGWVIEKLPGGKWKHAGLPQEGDIPCGKRNILTEQLRDLGLWDVTGVDKFIPEEYLLNSREVRLAILRGLMDTDGTVGQEGDGTAFSNKSPHLANGVAFLVRSLGGVASVTLKKRDNCYDVHVGIGVCPFKMQEKAAKWKLQPHKRMMNNIKQIQECGSERCRCLLIEHPDHLYITDDFVVTHNTGVNLDDTTGKNPRALIMMTPPFTANDMAQALGRVNRLNTQSGVRVRGVLSNTSIDDWNAGILEQKFRTLGAVVGGSTTRGMEALGQEPEDDTPIPWGESLIPKPKQPVVHYNTPYAHNNIIAQYGGRRTQVNGQWTTQFPSQADLDNYMAATAPKPAATPAPAPQPPTTGPTPSSPAPPPPQVAPAPQPAPAAAAPAPAAKPPPKQMSQGQKLAIQTALRFLAAADSDMARVRNGEGFSKFDGQFGHSLAASPFLSDRQAEAGLKLVQKYQRQLNAHDPSLVQTAQTYPTQPAAPAQQPTPAVPTQPATPAPAQPATPTPAAKLPPVATRAVNTRNGPKHVHAFSPGQGFWRVWKSGNRPSFLSAGKNPRTGEWEATIWGATPQEVQQNAEQLNQLGGFKGLAGILTKSLQLRHKYRGR